MKSGLFAILMIAVIGFVGVVVFKTSFKQPDIKSELADSSSKGAKNDKVVSDSIFRLEIEDSFSLAGQNKLTIPVGILGASKKNGQGVMAAEVVIEDLPDFLSNPVLVVSDKKWLINDPNKEKGETTLTASGFSAPLQEDNPQFLEISLDVVGKVKKSSFNMSITLSDDNLPSQSHSFNVGQIEVE